MGDIAIVLDVNPVEYCGGAERWALTLAHRLAKRGFHISIYVPAKNPYIKEIHDRIEVEGIRSFYKILGFKTISRPLSDPVFLSKLKDLETHHDVIFLNNLAVVYSSLFKQSKVLGIIHDYFPFCPLRDIPCTNGTHAIVAKDYYKCIHCIFSSLNNLKHLDMLLFRDLVRKSLYKLDGLVLVSNAQYSILKTLRSLPRKSAIYISGPMLSEKAINKSKCLLEVKKEKIAISYIGGMKKSRGFDKFVAVVLNILKYCNIFSEIHVHGKIEERSAVSMFLRLFSTLKSRGVILHMGYLPRYDDLLQELLVLKNVVLSTSRYPEPAPLYVLETFALGSIVLALRRLYGPYELSLKILSLVSKNLVEEYRHLAQLFSSLIINPKEKRTKEFVRYLESFLEHYYNEKMHLLAGRAALKVSDESFRAVLRAVED